jgi:hypothetical protein
MNGDYYWWKEKGNDVAKCVFSYMQQLDTEQSYISANNYRNMRLYGNVEMYTARGYSGYRAEESTAMLNRVTLNIVQSMVDTVVSKITKNRPKPTFLTEGGDWSLQRKAQKLTQFIEGQFYSTKFYQLAVLAFKDSAIQGTGAIKIYREGAEIKAERVFIDELTVDDHEAIYSEPRQMHQKKYIHKDVLAAKFPNKAMEIERLGSAEMSSYASNTYDKAKNMILVTESWHLKSSKDSKDGKHAISIDNCTLIEGSWEHDYFPFVLFRYSVRPLGFWGQGLAEQLTGLQLEINKILRTIQVSMHLVSVPKIYIEASSNIVSAHLNNKIGGIVKFVGQPPIEGKLGTIPVELFAHLDRLYARAYEIAGVSQLSANSQKPSGLDSGKALREYNDIESERFLDVGKRYEQAFLEATPIYIDLIKEIAEEEGSYTVKVKGDKFLETLDWKDVSLDKDMYLMQVFPTSALASEPAGRLADVKDLMALGFIGQEDAMKLLDFPDLRQFYNFNNAGVEDIERAIELIIDKGEYETPEPYQNLSLGITKMQQAYLLYRSMNAPESRLELFRRWMEDASALLKKAEPPPVLPIAASSAPEAAPLAPAEELITPAAQSDLPLAPPTPVVQ